MTRTVPTNLERRGRRGREGFHNQRSGRGFEHLVSPIGVQAAVVAEGRRVVIQSRRVVASGHDGQHFPELVVVVEVAEDLHLKLAGDSARSGDLSHKGLQIFACKGFCIRCNGEHKPSASNFTIHVKPLFCLKRGKGIEVGVHQRDDVHGRGVVLCPDRQPTVVGELGERREKHRIHVGGEGRGGDFVLEPGGCARGSQLHGIHVVSRTADQKVVLVLHVEVQAVGRHARQLALGVFHHRHQPQPRVGRLGRSHV